MKWEHKAKTAKICADLPSGDRLYKFLQKHFGRLNTPPASRLSMQLKLARWILEQGLTIKDKRFFEVGTGHTPVVPIGFFLSGAAEIITVDLHRRIDFNLIQNDLLALPLYAEDQTA